MTRSSRAQLGLLLLALALGLSACGTPAAESWPGLAATDELAYVAFGPHLYAIDLSNGKQAWTFPPIPERSSGGGFFSFLSPSTPVPNGSASNFFADPGLTSEMLLVGSVRPATSHSGVVFALDPATGQPRWCLAFDAKAARPESDASLTCPTPPDAPGSGFLGVAPATDSRIIGGITITEGVAYFGLASGRVYAVHVEDDGDSQGGTVQWSFETRHAIWAAPQVAGDTVYVVSFDHFIYALNRADGSLKWKKDLGAASAGSPSVVDGTVYVGSFGNKLYALDATTGEEKWPALETNNWVWGGPVARDGVLYFTDLSGTVFAVDAQTGSQKWAVTPGGIMRAAPAVTGKAVYVGDRRGNLFALDPANGGTLWTQSMKGELLTAPLVVGDETLLVSIYKGDNLLVAYTTAGTFKWAYAPSR